MQEPVSDTDVREWIEDETRHVDIVASWESLCDTYDALRFSDPLADVERLEEFRWIVQQMNSFLTRMRTKLLSCRDEEAMVSMLAERMVPAGKMDLGTRKALAFQKLRQQWIRSMVTSLTAVIESKAETKEDMDGWRGYAED